MSHQEPGRDFERESDHRKVVALLHDAADFVSEESIPQDLVAKALGESSSACRPNPWRRNTLLVSLGMGSILLVWIAALSHSRVHSSFPIAHAVPEVGVIPIVPLPGKTPRDGTQIADAGDRRRVADISNAPRRDRTQEAGDSAPRLVSHTSQKRARVLHHRRPPRAIWSEEIVQSREQGILIPVVTVESRAGSHSPELEPDIAVVPVRSGVTRCAAPNGSPTGSSSGSSIESNPPNTKEEK